MNGEEAERIATLEAITDMHIKQCNKHYDETKHSIADIYKEVGEIKENQIQVKDNQRLILDKQCEHLKEHKEHDQQLFRTKLAVGGAFLASLLSFIGNLLI
jgi:hypothetical protein